MPIADRAHRLEQLIGRDTGRGAAPLMAAASGGLARAADALSAARAVTLLTGFYIPRAQPPDCETDGPIGTAFLASALVGRGVAVRVVTDAPCAPVVGTALIAAGIDARCPLEVVTVDGFELGEPMAEIRARHAADPPSHMVSIERCGPAADGVPRNIRGESVATYTAPLHLLFEKPAFRIGIGDGGNELGMGVLPPELVAAHVPDGAEIACRFGAEALIVAGVSNWGAAALALLVGGPDAADIVNGNEHDHLLEAIVAAGAVDGIRLRPTMSVDDLEAAEHRAVLDALADAVRT